MEERFIHQSCEDFVSALSTKAPVPGGGGAAALVGALGAALGAMVGNLTLGKKKYADVQADIEAMLVKSADLQARLLDFVQKDAEAFAPLSRAYGLPAETDAQKAEKARVMEKALVAAAAVPLQLMETLCDVITLHEEYAGKGSAIAISDVGVGVALCKAALQSASLNVFINTAAMADEEEAGELNQKANALLEQYLPMADEIFDGVRARLV